MQFFSRKNKVFNFLNLVIVLVLFDIFSMGCLITNCPRGGKRSGKFSALEANIKSCVSCGPGNTGQCFGPSICCGPFGCLIRTPETLKCQREGFFHNSEPCVAGISYCRKNTGRCAMEGVCCNQDACFVDRQCSLEAGRFLGEDSSPDFYNFPGIQNGISIEK